MTVLSGLSLTDQTVGRFGRRRFLAGLALIGASVVVACGPSGSSQSANDASAATAVARVSTGMNTMAGAAQSMNASVVKMTAQNTFDPATTTVLAGGTVTWMNDANAPDSATFDPAKAGTAADISLPPGVSPFDSGPVLPGHVWSHSFATPGTYQYVGNPNEAAGMKGTIVVVTPTPAVSG